MFNLMPNFTVCAPKNKEELEKIIDWSLTFDGPLVVKYPKSQKASTTSFCLFATANGIITRVRTSLTAIF